MLFTGQEEGDGPLFEGGRYGGRRVPILLDFNVRFIIIPRFLMNLVFAVTVVFLSSVLLSTLRKVYGSMKIQISISIFAVVALPVRVGALRRGPIAAGGDGGGRNAHLDYGQIRFVIGLFYPRKSFLFHLVIPQFACVHSKE